MYLNLLKEEFEEIFFLFLYYLVKYDEKDENYVPINSPLLSEIIELMRAKGILPIMRTRFFETDETIRTLFKRFLKNYKDKENINIML